LFAAILARPELAITLFPDVCREFLSDRCSATFDAMVVEIKLAFSRLLDSVPDNLKIIFVIDGLDEYTGDLNELCDLFARAANSRSVKLLDPADQFLCATTALQDIRSYDCKI
jgi:hypothetical protein